MNNGRKIEIVRGDTLDIEFYPYLGDVSDVLDAWFTVKAQKGCSDADALLQVSMFEGLLVVNKTPATVSGNGTLTLTANGRCSVNVDEIETAKLPTGKIWWDIQLLRDPDIIETPLLSTGYITRDVTRAT